MDYPFENLGPERFQQFCQALLLREYPGMQCFPVGQPDGGRDFMRPVITEGKPKEFIMFQVKYSRNPQSQVAPHQWLAQTMKAEAPKVKRQIIKGAKLYVLITNISGTAHPDSGSIDTLNSLLTEDLGINAFCLWRDDLSRRLDVLWDLKWTYPDLMNGPDLIRALITNSLSESRERRLDAVRAFITHQYYLDEYVKFKQVDLENRLLDLFIDVPVQTAFTWWQTKSNRHHNSIRGRYLPGNQYISRHPMAHQIQLSHIPPSELLFIENTPGLGATTLLLSQLTDGTRSRFLVLEGAPGQGKSTIVQYVCQVHRMRLLNFTTELELIPEKDRNQAVRLPIKVDLRDFSTWIAQTAHSTPDAGQNELFQSPERTLEGFLAALIQRQSGGIRFDASDLVATARASTLLLALDGLDEVADIERREEVVNEIIKGSERLRAVSPQLQVVVTSRPAAFENSPGLPEDKFSYHRLDSVTTELIDEYCIKWIRAKRLNGHEGSEVKRILKEKLNQPHLRELARNPMQLAILLNLIHTRGVSLPDKRTALYDSYIDHFFNRESEKSAIVRDNRDTLIDIHRYVAWLLHVESERPGKQSTHLPAGAIEETRLKSTIRDYLIDEGRNPSLTDALFKGTIERVVALVSRVQGTFEFEVQPLREYFTARYLHETAPYSPTGAEKRGTLLDRFDAIARNFYWLNVTRFYAGCYSKGELASLLDCLDELVNDDTFRHLSHPKILGANLLGDWVFSQHPKYIPRVISKVFDVLGIKLIVASARRRHPGIFPLTLPLGCGKSELVEQCFSILRQHPPGDFSLDVVDVLLANSDQHQVKIRWKSEIQSDTKDNRNKWLNYGMPLGAVSNLTSQELEMIFSDDPLSVVDLRVILKSRHFGFLEADASRSNSTLEAMLNLSARVTPGIFGTSWLEDFGQLIDPSRYALVFLGASEKSLADTCSQLLLGHSRPSSKVAKIPGIWDDIKPFITIAAEQSDLSSLIWYSNIEPWDKVAEAIRTSFGERWSAFQLANLSAVVTPGKSPLGKAYDLLDSSTSLCWRTRYARLRAGAPAWWATQIENCESAEEISLWLLVHFTWAGPTALIRNLDLSNDLFEKLSDEQSDLLIALVQQAVALTARHTRRRTLDLGGNIDWTRFSCKILALMRPRANKELSQSLYDAWIQSPHKRFTTAEFDVFQADLIDHLIFDVKSLDATLGVISSAYKADITWTAFGHEQVLPSRFLPAEAARKIIDDQKHYPGFLVAAAEEKCRAMAANRIKPVGKVAEDEGWFSD